MKSIPLIASAIVALFAIPAQAQLRYTPPAPMPVPVIVPSYPAPAMQSDIDDRDQVIIGLTGAPKREAAIIQAPLAPLAIDPPPAPPTVPTQAQTTIQPPLSVAPPMAILVPPAAASPTAQPAPLATAIPTVSEQPLAPKPQATAETPVLQAAKSIAQTEEARSAPPQQKPVDGCLSTDISKTWTVEAGKTLRQELRRWAKEVCWTTVFRTADDYPFAAGASFDGTFINAIQALFEDLRTMEPIPTAVLYTGNKVILVSTQANPQGE